MGALDGKAVLITGAGRGLGAAFAKSAAAEGASIVANDIDPLTAERTAAAIRAAGGDAVAAPADVATWDGAQAIVEACVARHGRIDGLVNNAGVIRLGRVWEMAEADLRLLVQVNLLGAMFCARHASPHMLAAGKGAIVNVISGAQCGQDAMGGYGATKGGLASLTYAWAVELAEHGIRVNAISPMAGDTGMTADTMAYWAGRGIGRASLAKHGLEVMPKAEVNAPVVDFLLSDAASGVNGQVIRIVGEQLSLMTHPAIAYPPRLREGWTFDAIAELFRTELAARQSPLGVAQMVQTLPPAG